MSGKAKSSPESFLLGMHLLGVTASETMLVGDSIHRDIVPAKALGMLACMRCMGTGIFMKERRGIERIV